MGPAIPRAARPLGEVPPGRIATWPGLGARHVKDVGIHRAGGRAVAAGLARCSLIYDGNIKTGLLDYIHTGLLFSDQGVDPNIIAINRCVGVRPILLR